MENKARYIPFFAGLLKLAPALLTCSSYYRLPSCLTWLSPGVATLQGGRTYLHKLPSMMTLGKLMRSFSMRHSSQLPTPLTLHWESASIILRCFAVSPGILPKLGM